MHVSWLLSLLLLLLLFSFPATKAVTEYYYYYKPWFTATQAPNNGTIYVVGGGIPNYMESLVPRPLFIMSNYNSSSEPVTSTSSSEAVTGANGAKSLSFPLEGDCLYVATEICVLEVTKGGLKVRAIAGSCTEPGRRNGPLLFARFTSLTAISSVIDESLFFIALLDSSGRSDKMSSLLLADSWSVGEICLVEYTTFDISISTVPRQGGGFRELAVLVLTPLSANLILGRNGNGEKIMLGSVISWKTYNIISLNSSSSLLYSEWASDNNNNSTGHNNNNNVQDGFTACLLHIIMTGDGIPVYTAYMVDNTNATLWKIVLVVESDGVLAKTANIYKERIVEWNGAGLNSFFISKLLWRNCDTALRCLTALDTLNSRFIDIHSDVNEQKLNNDSCILPWQKKSICDFGHVWMPGENMCAPSPPGGYVDRSLFEWIPCPVGTYNPLSMAMSLLACRRCAPGSIAPFMGSVVCSFCNDTHPLQSTSGSECLATCLTTTTTTTTTSSDYGSLICKSCPPGSEPNQQGCQLCPENFYSPALDKPCLRCPPNFTSVEGATYCSVQCPPETCSPDGLSPCLASAISAHMVYTVADFKNSDGCRFLSIAVCSNGTVFLGNDCGYLIIYHGEGGSGDGVIWSVDMAYLQIKTLNAMTLSWDRSHLFVADTLEGLIAKVSDSGGQMEILLPKSANMMPLSLCWVGNEGLYVVDARNDSLIVWLAPDLQQPVHIRNVPWPGIVFVTPHESGRGVACLVEGGNDSDNTLYSIWRIEPLLATGAKSTLLSRVFKNYTSAPAPAIQPWISRWKAAETAICINNAVALISDRRGGDDDNLTITTNYDDTDRPRGANIVAASLMAPLIINHSSATELLFLLDAFSVQVIFSRSCECAPNFYKTRTNACVPCPPHTFSMAGANGCSACPSGEYMSLYGTCITCPLTLWWDDEVSGMYNPCRKMQGALSSATMQGISLTLLEAQDIADQNSYISVKEMDIVSNATILLTGIGIDLAIPPPDIWIKGDLLGRLWSLQSRITPKPFDPQGIAVLNHPGIWALCSQIVFPGEPCTCRHGALQLGYYNTNGWSTARNEATMEGLPGFSFTSVFVLRPDDNHMTAPILIKNGGGSISLVPHFPIGDMGVCLMGWPAQFNCSDPHYFWEFPSESYPGGACLPCPADTIAPAQSSVKCRPISYQNPLCEPGSFKTLLPDFSYTCRMCGGNTYSSTHSAIKCSQKSVLSCPQGFYVQEGGYTSENKCVQCVPCGESSIMIPFLVNPCPGNTQFQPYVCVAWLQSVPGYSISVLNLEKSSSYVSPSLRYTPCTGLPPFATWASGPQRDKCFFRCKFGINEPAVKEYAFYWALLSPENENNLWLSGGAVEANLFPYASSQQQQSPTTSSISISSSSSGSSSIFVSAVSAVCTPCNTSVCPEGMWRPQWNDGCGPPCYISPSLCQGRSDGCVSVCNVPENAIVQSYDTVDQDGRPVCLWRCNLGFFKTGETCSACNASLCRSGESYIGNSQCGPEMTLSQICLPCPANVRGGVLNLAAPDRGKCSYSCLKDYYYPNPNPNLFLQTQMACVQCSGTVTRCPAGYSVTCAVNPCRLCQASVDTISLSGKAVMVPTSDSVCRVQCMPGFHTISIWDRTVLSDKEISAYDPSEIVCEECSRRPFLPCPVLSCSPGYQILQGACAPCKTSLEMGCAEGTYAPPCPGGRVTQIIGCLNCPMYDLLVTAALESGDYVPDKWPTRMFVSLPPSSTSQQKLIIINSNTSKKQENSVDDCLTACVHGSVQVKKLSTVITCVACSALLPAPPKNAPYSGYYSTWNASDGLRWWPPEFDPPHLQRRQLDSKGNLRVESRAGLCWPCPSYTAAVVLLSSDDPCFFRWSSLTSTTNTNNNKDLSSLVASDMLVTGADNSNPAQIVWVWNGNSNNRRRNRLLLSYTTVTPSPVNAASTKKTNSNSLGGLGRVFCSKGQYPVPPLASWCAICPEDHYCTGGNAQPARCGPFYSAAMGSTSSNNCSCRPGFVPFSSLCVLEVPSLDFPCPLGFYKETAKSGQPQSMCFPCPAGTRESNDRCHDCPLQSTSKEGSSVCTCAATPANLTKKRNLNNNGPMDKMTTTTAACPSGDCPQGSSLDFTDSKCKSCAHKMAVSIPSVFPLTCSCGPGSYYGSVSQSPSVLQCLPCPRGKFSQFAGEAPCTPCPEGTITLLEGSTTLAACVKSNILDADVVVGGNHTNNNATFIKN